jgi:hypothetical protein
MQPFCKITHVEICGYVRFCLNHPGRYTSSFPVVSGLIAIQPGGRIQGLRGRDNAIITARYVSDPGKYRRCCQ